MDLKDIAAADLAWVMSREETYRTDGIQVPEPIRRLGALAKAIQDAAVGPGGPALESAVRDFTLMASAIRDSGRRLGWAVPESISASEALAILSDIEKKAANGAGTKDVVLRCERALTDAADVLHGVQRELGGLFIAGEGPVLPSGLRTSDDKSGSVGGEIIQLRHGLLLRQRKTGHRALFSEPKLGTFCYVWVSQDGKSSTEPTGTEAANWRSDTWEECADAIEVKPVVLTPGGLLAADAGPSAPNQKAPSSPAGPQTPANVEAGAMIRDWNPSADETAKSAADLKAAMDKAGFKLVDIDVPRLVEKFKAEKGNAPAKRPSMAFYHWACRELKGTVT